MHDMNKTVEGAAAGAQGSGTKQALGLVNDLRKKDGVHPVDRKLFAVIHERLTELEGLVHDGDPQARERLRTALNLISDELKGDLAWEVADGLHEVLPLFGSERYLYRALMEESARPDDRPHSWQTLYGRKSLDELIEALEGDPSAGNVRLVRRRLHALYVIRNDRGRHDRARESLRASYLRWSWRFLLSLLFASVLTLALGPEQSLLMNATIAFLAGGLGSVLSGTLRLRDLDRITQLDKMWRTFGTQAVLGGTLAVIVLLVLLTGVIQVAGLDLSADPPRITVYLIGLLSGFSEPFALSTLERVAALGR